MELSKGSNAILSALGSRVTATLRWPAGGDADCSALLCGANGKVLSDEHFVFYNAPSSPDGSVCHDGKRSDGHLVSDAIVLELDAVPPGVERIVLAASMDAATFGSLAGPVILELTGGTETVRYAIADASTQTALLFGEVYRRDGTWKLRAVGQGYATGLAGLAQDFGVSIAADDGPAIAQGGAGSSTTSGPVTNWLSPPVPAGYERR